MTKGYLAWHDLAVDAADVNACVEAGLVVSINDVTAPGLVGSDAAVIWALLAQ